VGVEISVTAKIYRRIFVCAADFQTKDISMIQDSPAVIDRSVQVAKLKTDLETSTFDAEQCGVPLPDVVLSLLQRAEDLCRLGADRGLDLSTVSAFFSEGGQ
jgi:hypothetical protein